MLDSATIKIFLPQGDPQRIKVAELSNWSGKAIASPRSELENFLNRSETSKPGVYILIGMDPEDGKQTAYIGEAEILADRIKQHKSRDDWNSLLAFFSKDENLTKSHIRYLEGRLIQISNDVGRYKLTNKKSSGAHLPEADQHEMEVFLSKIKLLLPILGTDLTNAITTLPIEKSNNEFLKYTTKNVEAHGFRSPKGFVVTKGSTAVLKERSSAATKGPWVISLRNKLKEEGKLVEKSDHLEFTHDVEFGSPSAAAAVIQGGTAQGTILWKNNQGKTLKEIESNI